MGSPSSIGTFDLCSGRARSLHGSTGCTCRNTAAVFSARRTAIWPPSGKRRPPGRRWKDSRRKIDGTGTCSKRGVSPFCVLKSFPQGVEKVWGTDGEFAKKMLRPREMLKKHGGNEWKSERNWVVENSVENVENFSESHQKSGFPQVRRKKFSDVENG